MIPASVVASHPTQMGWIPRIRALDALRYPLAAAIVLSLVFIGGDRIAVVVGSFNVRFVTFPILATFLLAICYSRGAIHLNRTLTVLFLLLLICSALSIPNSVSPRRTIAYTIWMGFTFFVIVPVFYNLARHLRPMRAYRLWIYAMRFSSLLLLCELPLRLVNPDLFFYFPGPRPHIWFYEPSYAALHFSAYFTLALYLTTQGRRWAFPDALLSFFALLALISLTALGGVLVAIGVCLGVSRYRGRLMLAIALAGTVLTSAVIYFLSDSPLFTLMFGFLLGQELDALIFALIDRGGTRAIRFLWGWDAFLQHPWFGIGFGADQQYTGMTGMPAAAAEFMRPWHDPFFNPFINPYIEAAATMGIFGLVAFALIPLYPLRKLWELWGRRDGPALLAIGSLLGFMVMFACLQIEGTFLRYYVWATFGFSIGLADRCLRSRGSESAS